MLYHSMTLEKKALVEANNLTDKQLQDFYQELSKIPTQMAPINGQEAVLCFKFMEDTGCRVNETIHIKKQDVNFRARILTVMFPKSETRCKCSTWRHRDLYSKGWVLDSADNNCKQCHGKGKWKQPQHTTITPRLIDELKTYCDGLKDDQYLFPVTRKTLWKWGKKAGVNANINIFQQKKQKLIEGIFLHLFRALCSKRTISDAMSDPYKDQLVACKLRHSFASVTDRYTKIDINYLWSWEEGKYGHKKE